MATLFAREMKGILLVGGTGSRLYPVTQVLSKHLLPVYNKPMVYYPLSTLMLAKIKDILIITNPENICHYQELLGDGSQYGISLTYKSQTKARGIADALIVGEEFIGDDSVCLILGDNIFYGHDLPTLLHAGKEKIKNGSGAVVFGYNVSNPVDYGVIEYDEDGVVLSIEEKPPFPKSNCAAVGLYMYDNTVVDYAKSINPSPRGELEITSINQIYLEVMSLDVMLMGRGYAWFDAGNCDSLFRVSAFVQNIEKRQGLKIACLEEIAYYLQYITKEQLEDFSKNLPHSEYCDYVSSISKKI